MAPLNEEDLKQVRTLLTESIGGDDFKKTIKDVLRPIVVGVVQAETKALGEKHEELATKFGEIDKTLKETPAPKVDDKKGAESEETKTLRAQVLALEKKDQQREEERKKERDTALRNARRAVFAEAASKLEMRGIPQAWSFLENQLEDGEDGAVVIRVKRDGYEEKVAIGDFLASEFPNSEDGKIHYPAKNAGGSGGKSWESGAGSSGGKKPDVGGMLAQAGWGDGAA